MRAEPHPRQVERLRALRDYAILDTPPESAFDEIARLAAVLCGTPIAVVNLIDEARQWFKSEVGIGVRELPLADSICAHAILEHAYVEIPDTLADARLSDNPLCLGDRGLRFYAGALLATGDGLPLGTLCVLDHAPRTLEPVQREALRVLARQVMAQLELRRAYVAQRALADELARLNRNKDDFLATLGHELRNPLQPMRVALAVLERTDAGPDVARGAREVIRRQNALIERLVDDLLDTARIGQGTLQLSLAPVALRDVIERAIETSRPRIEAGGHRLTADLPGASFVLQADAHRLVQVLVNLLNNAARYTPPGGRIGIVAGAGEGAGEGEGEDAMHAVVRVSDTGRGIVPDELDRIFEPFVRGSAGDADEEQPGLGVGLALARRLAALHGGTLVAHSDGQGRGATFTLTLPRAISPAIDPRSSADRPRSAAT